jgi:hypothetical protein
MTLEEEDEFIQHILANHDTATSEGTLVEREVNDSDFVRSNR